MAQNIIYSDEQALNGLKSAFQTAGDEYLENYRRLTNMLHEITSGHITGPLADELLKKFEEKKGVFDQVLQTINDGYDNMGVQSQKFNKLMDVAATIK